MANSLYGKGRELFGNGGVNWVSDDIRIALLSAGYTPNLATHQYVSDLGANIVARSGALQNKTNVAGVLDADDIVISNVSGSQITRIAIYKYNASDSAAPLIGLIDTAAYGLPYTPDGTNITVLWPASGYKILQL